MKKTFLMLMCGLILSPVSIFAQVTRVEVDWEVRVHNPDAEAVSPQISIVMANRRDLSGDFAEFRINPEYEGQKGGMKIDTWRGPQELDQSSVLQRAPLSQDDDHIRFTTAAEVDHGNTKYTVRDVQSSNWGEVNNSEIAPCLTAGSGTIRFSMALTLSESEVEFGHNRVEYVIAKEVRYYIGNDLAKRDRTGYYIFKEGSNYVGPISPEEVIDEYIAF